MKVITLRDGKERSLLRRHPWAFEASIASGKADAGETVRVQAHDGRFLAWAAYSPHSMIRLRAWSFVETDRIDAAFFGRRIAQALAIRARLPIASDAMRLIHGEADGLPGLIVDRYAQTLCAQFLSVGVERWKPTIAEHLRRATGLAGLYERSDTSVRALEGLEPLAGWLKAGKATGRANAPGTTVRGTEATDGSEVTEATEATQATEVTIREHGWRFTLDVATGHKTGFYLDQRDNRKLFADTVRQFACQRVLNCYCYTGGFSVAALAGGAQDVTSVDSSAPALARATANVALNGFDAAHHTALDADVNQTLRDMLSQGRRFDAIVLDPPKFAPTAAHAERAARAYKDINRLAFLLLEPGGVLFTFSCSGGIAPDLFHKIVAGAGLDAGIDGLVYARLGAAPDHPMTVTFPESGYLKGLVVIKA